MTGRAADATRAPTKSQSGPILTSRRLDDPLLRPDQAAALLNVKTSWVYDAVRTGTLPCVRVGRHVRFTKQMLEEWLNSR